jgi:hypothetical protein
VHEQTLERPLYLVSRTVGGVARTGSPAARGTGRVRLAKDRAPIQRG